MLRIVQAGSSLPFSYAVDPNSEFMPGMIGQLNTFGNQIVCGVSNGSAPIGIIDDIKTNSFTSASIDEVKIAFAADVATTSNGRLVTSREIKVELDNPHIIARSFITNVDVYLKPKNGVIVIPANTPLNYDNAGSGTPDSVRIVVSYTYQVPNIPGDDSTMASGRVTVWYQRILAQTDQFETNQRYPLNANLFVSELGLLTTKQISENQPSVGFVTGPPSAMLSTLEFMWI